MFTIANHLCKQTSVCHLFVVHVQTLLRAVSLCSKLGTRVLDLCVRYSAGFVCLVESNSRQKCWRTKFFPIRCGRPRLATAFLRRCRVSWWRFPPARRISTLEKSSAPVSRPIVSLCRPSRASGHRATLLSLRTGPCAVGFRSPTRGALSRASLFPPHTDRGGGVWMSRTPSKVSVPRRGPSGPGSFGMMPTGLRTVTSP